jgi:hypothetical protein
MVGSFLFGVIASGNQEGLDERILKREASLPTMGRRRREVNLVEAAVELAGGVSAVSRELGVTRQTVYNWMAAGHMLDVTFRYVAGLSKLSGVPLEQLTREPRSDSS